MEEPKAVHPFSSHFRSQLSDVLSRPAPPILKDEKVFLETEIDSYSGVEFTQPSTTDTKRPPTPPKPVLRSFTFEKSHPLSTKAGEANTLSLPKYAEVKKPKNKPQVPPKPKIRTKDAPNNTLPHSQKFPDEQAKISKEDYFFRVNSLPNLTPEINPKDTRASGKFLLVDGGSSTTPGYGQLNQVKQPASDGSVCHMTHNDADYCDVIPDSPSAVHAGNGSLYENIYEDITSQRVSGELVLQTERQDGSDSDYTLMCSPVSEINFTFSRKSVYENVAAIPTPNSDVFNTYENFGSPFPVGDHNIVGLPEQSQNLALTKDQISPTSSYDDQDSSAYSVQSSMPSTTASSFQRVQVCFFPPSPPPYSYDDEKPDRPESTTSGSSLRSRSSRSRIPVPIKPKQHPKSPSSDVPETLPPTPTPSPVVRSKSRSKQAKPIELSPPSPPGNELTPYSGKPLGPSGKGAKWYEKLGCIQTDTIRPSEPYGRPGERKRSKSLNKEHQRRSQFFLQEEPNESNPPNPA